MENRPATLKVYAFLTKLGRPKSYLGKIMLMAFLGTHIPLIALSLYAIAVANMEAAIKWKILLVVLLATLAGTAVTLTALTCLLAPITLTFMGMRRYVEDEILPDLPTHFSDEAGVLMADTQRTLTQLDASIAQLRNYDVVTELPNRHLFMAQLEKKIEKARRNEQSFALTMLDLDSFSSINNVMGQEKGDFILRQSAHRLESCLRPNDIAARISGDEFAVIHDAVTTPDQLAAQWQQILRVLTEEMLVENERIMLGACLGIAVFPDDETQAQLLMSCANVALREAKADGRGSVRFFSAAMNDYLRQRVEMEGELRRALERDELELHYQPQIEAKSGACVGMEALVRWQHPQRGLILPDDFLGIAENAGLIAPITNWVLHTACAQNRQWQKMGLPSLRMAVNLSPSQFHHPHLAENVERVLQETEQSAHLLELEITENLLMEQYETALPILHALRRLGCVLALDDFGTGYSSLSYLKSLPLDVIKIDRDFVRGLPENATDAAIARAVMTLAQGLNLEVTAEGVENPAQGAFLRALGCNRLQGFSFSRPIPAAECTAFLQRNFQVPEYS